MLKKAPKTLRLTKMDGKSRKPGQGIICRQGMRTDVCVVVGLTANPKPEDLRDFSHPQLMAAVEQGLLTPEQASRIETQRDTAGLSGLRRLLMTVLEPSWRG